MKSIVVAFSLAVGLTTLPACEAAGPALPAPGPNAIEVTIKTEPGGGNIVVDGAPVGTSPQTVKLNPGPHRVRAAMSGYYPSPETKIQVGAQEPKEITLPLVASH
jgi:hypothetical protein